MGLISENNYTGLWSYADTTKILEALSESIDEAAKRIVEEVEKGNVSALKTYDAEKSTAISMIRNSPKRSKIVNIIVSKKDEVDAKTLFNLVFDMEEHKNVTRELVYEGQFEVTIEILTALLNKSSFGLEYLIENFDAILLKFESDLDFIFSYIMENRAKCQQLLAKLRLYPNLHIRSLFMCYLIRNGGIYQVYDNAARYLANANELMAVDDLCAIARAALSANLVNLFYLLKEYIFMFYPANDLAKCVIFSEYNQKDKTYCERPSQNGIIEFEKDADRYFEAATSKRVYIAENFSEKISKELLESLRRYFIYFKDKDGHLDWFYHHIDEYGLTRLVNGYVDKYLDLSTNKTHEYISHGSTASCYRIGDFAFKLLEKKWSYEDIICPDLYLILPNLEEKYIRNEDGVVVAGVEVQKYLSRDASHVSKEILEAWKKELNRFGYRCWDKLVGGDFGPNVRFLDSYLDAGAGENVPDWFKEHPLVLVDRDAVLKLDNKHPKVLPPEIIVD